MSELACSSHAVIENAGSVLFPAPGSLQADMHLPEILTIQSHLGGVSTILYAYKAPQTRSSDFLNNVLFAELRLQKAAG